MSNLLDKWLDKWPYSRRSLWIGLGVVVVVVVALVVFLVVGWSGSGGSSAGTSTPTATDELPPPTPIPVQTVAPGPSPSAAITVVPATPMVTANPQHTAADASGVAVSLVSLRRITTQAYAQGEVSGPGLAVTVVVKNGSKADVDLSGVEVNLAYGPDGKPGVTMMLDGHNSPFPQDTLAAGGTAETTRVFTTATNAVGTQVAVQVTVGATTYVMQATVGS